MKKAYPDKTDYMAFMGQYSTLVGTSTFFMLLIGREVIKFLGWEVGALMTPVFMTVLAVPFFGWVRRQGTTSFRFCRTSERRSLLSFFFHLDHVIMNPTCGTRVFEFF